MYSTASCIQPHLVFNRVLYSRVFCIQQRLVFNSVLYSRYSWNPERLEIESFLYSKTSCIQEGLSIQSVLYSRAFCIWERLVFKIVLYSRTVALFYLLRFFRLSTRALHPTETRVRLRAGVKKRFISQQLTWILPRYVFDRERIWIYFLLSKILVNSNFRKPLLLFSIKGDSD